MFSHAPKNYICPICLGVKGVESKDTMLRNDDMVYKNNTITVFINSFFIGNNSGHAIVVPNTHYENIFDLPADVSVEIYNASKKIAVAMKKAYKCQGITLLQNNEPVGGQHAFHYHQHIFPRYPGDNLYSNMLKKRPTSPKERKPFARKLKREL